MLSKILILLIAGLLVYLALKQQLARLFDRPDLRALRNLAAQARQGNEASQRAGNAPGAAANSASTGPGGQAVTLISCDACGVHTPEHLLQREGTEAGRICRRCAGSR